jgi:hypothetical protein
MSHDFDCQPHANGGRLIHLDNVQGVAISIVHSRIVEQRSAAWYSISFDSFLILGVFNRSCLFVFRG